MMHCNGKCQLYRQLKKAADEEAENNKLPLVVLKIKNLDTFIEMNAVWQPVFTTTSHKENTFSNYIPSSSHGYLNRQLKPPQTFA